MHCFIISWQGYHDRAHHIASTIHEHVDRLTVVYSNEAGEVENGPGDWVGVPNDWFYARKFEACLDRLADDETMLLIQADASFEDWPGLAARCASTMRDNPAVGIWSPQINATFWHDVRVGIAHTHDETFLYVAQPDGIVFAYGAAVARRLRGLNYADNTYGWGIDWLATCFCYVNNMLVVRDRSLVAGHTMGSGYVTDEAEAQMWRFLNQMTTQEQIMHRLLMSFAFDRAALDRAPASG